MFHLTLTCEFCTFFLFKTRICFVSLFSLWEAVGRWLLFILSTLFLLFKDSKGGSVVFLYFFFFYLLD